MFIFFLFSSTVFLCYIVKTGTRRKFSIELLTWSPGILVFVRRLLWQPLHLYFIILQFCWIQSYRVSILANSGTFWFVKPIILLHFLDGNQTRHYYYMITMLQMRSVSWHCLSTRPGQLQDFHRIVWLSPLSYLPSKKKKSSLSYSTAACMP